jgi:uncharacterized damage-inducible protein DinB
MEVVEYIQRQVRTMSRLSGAAIQGTTDEQFNWAPPGTANAIKTTLLHMIAAEDYHIQHVAQGKPLVWQTGNWGDRIGVSTPPGRGQGWDEIKDRAIALAPVLEYQAAVHAATDAYLQRLTPEELDRQVRFFGRDQPVAQVIATAIAHVAGHAGEIAALRGIQGVKGLPF